MSMVDEWEDAAQLEREDETRRANEFAREAMEAHRRFNPGARIIQVRTGKRPYRFVLGA